MKCFKLQSSKEEKESTKVRLCVLRKLKTSAWSIPPLKRIKLIFKK